MPFLQRSRKPIIILVSVIFSIGAFLFFKNNAPQEPVVIYKVTQPAPKQKQAAAGNDATHADHEHPHDPLSHSYVLEASPNSEGYDWRDSNGLGVSGSETDPWEQTYGQPEKVSENADAETYPPPDWHKTENPELYIQYLRAQLIKQFGDIPQIHIFVEWREKRIQGIPIKNAEEYITFLEAQYHLWPSEMTLRTLKTLQEEKAAGLQIIFKNR